MVRQTRRHAISAGREFNLTVDECYDLFSKNCHYCGASPSNVAKHPGNNGNFIYNGIDRMNNRLGYSIDNVVTCCKICNRAKNNMGYDEFILYLNNLSRFRINHNEDR